MGTRVRIRRSYQEGSPTGYLVTGPTEGEVRNVTLGLEANAVASTYTVSLTPPLTTTIVTPHDSIGDSTFSPTSVTLTSGSPSQNIAYSPGSYGPRSIIFTNNRGLPNVTKQFNSLVQAAKVIQSHPDDPRWNDYRYGADHGGYKFFGGVYDPAKPLSMICQDVRDLPVDPNSDTIMGAYISGTLVNLQHGQSTYGGNFNVHRLGTVPVAGFINHSSFPEESDVGPFPIDPLAAASGYYSVPVIQQGWPGDEYMPAGPLDADQHVTVFSPDDEMLYELYGGYTNDGGANWRGYLLAIHNLATGALRHDTYSTTSGSGLPIYPFLYRYDEVARGEIAHALRFNIRAWNGRNKCQWPARHAGGYYGNPTTTLPWGSRIRLKDSVYQQVMASWSSPYPEGHNPEWYLHSQAVLTAMWKYGMWMNDYGWPNWSVDGATDSRFHTQMKWLWDDTTPLDRAVSLFPTDFEVIRIEPGFSITGPTVAQVGVPVTYTLSRIPIDDINYSSGINVLDVTGTPYPTILLAQLTLEDATPTVQVEVVFNYTGVRTVRCVESAYWIVPPDILVTVT